MFDLVWKDFVAARKYLFIVIPLGTVQLAVLASTPPIYPIAVLSFAALLAFGSIAVEESQRTERLWNSLPVSRDKFVTARYVVALIGMTVGLTLGWVTAQLVPPPLTIAALGPAIFTNLPAHAFMFGMLVLAAAIFLPLHFRFGPGRAVVLFLTVAVAVIVAVSLLAQLILRARGYPSPITDPEAWRAARPEVLAHVTEWSAARHRRLLSIFVATSILALVLSLDISRRLYDRRDL